MPCLQVDDAIGIGASERVMGEVPKERRLADARLDR